MEAEILGPEVVKISASDHERIERLLLEYKKSMENLPSYMAMGNAPLQGEPLEAMSSNPEYEMLSHLESINNKSEEVSETLITIKNDVNKMNHSLEKERSNRISGDSANIKYTKKWNRISLAIGIVGLILAFIALFKP